MIKPKRVGGRILAVAAGLEHGKDTILIVMRMEEVALAAVSLGGMALFGRKSKQKIKAEAPQEPVASVEKSQPQPEAPPLAAVEPIELNLPPGSIHGFQTTQGRIVCRFSIRKRRCHCAEFHKTSRGAQETDNATEKEWEQRPYFPVGLYVHHVIPKFMIQGGDYMGTGTGKVGYTFEDEFSPDLVFDRPGRLAMANAGPNPTALSFLSRLRPHPGSTISPAFLAKSLKGGLANAISQAPRNVRDRPL